MARMDRVSALEDICARCGLSEDIVRRVLRAEQEHVIYCLQHGLTAYMLGRGTLIPEEHGSGDSSCIRTKFRLSSKVKTVLSSTQGFIQEENVEGVQDTEDIAGIRYMQLDSLL